MFIFFGPTNSNHCLRTCLEADVQQSQIGAWSVGFLRRLEAENLDENPSQDGRETTTEVQA